MCDLWSQAQQHGGSMDYRWTGRRGYKEDRGQNLASFHLGQSQNGGPQPGGPGALHLLPGSAATLRREAGPQFPNSEACT